MLLEEIQLEMLLLEGQYEAMFDANMIKYLTDLDKIHLLNFNAKYKEQIKWAKQTLKKNDRIVWFLRNVKGWYLSAMWEVFKSKTNQEKFIDKMPEDYMDEILKYLTKQEKVLKQKGGFDIFGGAGLYSPTRIKQVLEHYLSLGIHAIDNYTFGTESFDDLEGKFRDIETEWKNTRKRFIPEKNEKVFLKLNNDWAWYDLGRTGCPDEGDAMGHCGNVPMGTVAHITILSLREKVLKNGETWYKPHCTFIFDTSEKMLGEMKGRNNEKPKKELHKYIIPLLEDKRIKGIAGGGYLPKNNFSLLDLTEAEQEKLYKLKPALYTFGERIQKFGLDKQMLADAHRAFGKDIFNGHFFRFGRSKDLRELAGYHGGYTFEYVVKILVGDRDIDNYGSWDVDYATMEMHMDKAVENSLTSFIYNAYPDDEDERDWLNLLRDKDDEMAQHILDAYWAADQFGTEKEMVDDIVKLLKDWNEEDTDYGIQLYLQQVDEHSLFDSEYYFYVDLQDKEIYDSLMDSVGEPEDVNEFLKIIEDYVSIPAITLEEPYYGWSGFDEEYFNEELKRIIDEHTI